MASAIVVHECSAYCRGDEHCESAWLPPAWRGDDQADILARLNGLPSVARARRTTPGLRAVRVLRAPEVPPNTHVPPPLRDGVDGYLVWWTPTTLWGGLSDDQRAEALDYLRAIGGDPDAPWP